MSSMPTGTSWPVMSRTSLARRRASGTPRVRMPTKRELVHAAVALDDLVSDAGERTRHAVAVDHERHAQHLQPAMGRGVARSPRPIELPE